MPIENMAYSWTKQVGYPVLQVTVRVPFTLSPPSSPGALALRLRLEQYHRLRLA